MKISEIHFTDYQQFKNLTLNLTYPTGHPKAGQPLDKVCFIGQSGTGKTTILNVIRETMQQLNPEYYHWSGYNAETEKSKKNIFNINFALKTQKFAIDFEAHKQIYEYDFRERVDFRYRIIKKDQDINFEDFLKSYKNKFKRLYYVFLPAELIEKGMNALQNTNFQAELKDIFITEEQIIEQNIKLQRLFYSKTHFDFGEENPFELWKIILLDAKEYINKELIISQQIASAVMRNDDVSIEKLKKEFQELKQNAENPITKLAKILNPLLEKSGIEISNFIDIKNIEETQFIKLQTKGGIYVPYRAWSTGTKQIVLSATPIFKLRTDESIILFDEPERSLYPDLQKDLISFYTNLAPTAQFFFATHSPIIASQFDPWEIVELKFDEEYNIYQEDYIKEDEERHIDNYNFYPKYLRWDSILTQVYDMDTSGAELRHEALEELTQLEEDMKYYKEKNKTEEWNEAVKRHKELSFKLNWKR